MSEIRNQRKAFFEFLFGERDGYLRLATRTMGEGVWKQDFYHYPSELEVVLDVIDRNVPLGDVYYAPFLYRIRDGKKEYVQDCTCAWADLDACEPDLVKVPPTIALETSPDRYQALWLFRQPMAPEDAEHISRRIAYAYEEYGADISGWDLTQMLRVPMTYNYKYKELKGPHTVRVIIAEPERKYDIEDFASIPEVVRTAATDIPFPDEVPDKTAEDILDEIKLQLNPRALDLFGKIPDSDWSRKLWELELMLFEANLEPIEVFIVAKEAACNKYKRDGRDQSLLWKDVCRAYHHVEAKHTPLTSADVDRVLRQSPLLSDEERAWAEGYNTFVEDYIDWAKTLGDAAWQYHQAGAFIILSSLLSGDVRLPTSFGTIIPNLWFMILADTTLTRKTTAMDLAIDMIIDIDKDAVLATDGSIEGLMTSLSTRPGRPSIFLRDEFTGLMEMISKRDYYAGMMETLTKLYDGKYQKRVLRKEIIELRDPVVILFAGGIKDKMSGLLTHEHVASGFIPRFIFISAESDITRLKPLGPPTDTTVTKKRELLQRLRDIHEHYGQKTSPQAEDGHVKIPRSWHATLTDDAWVRYNRFESTMVESALKSPIKEQLTPTMSRLAISGLKAAVLIAASTRLDEEVVVTERDLIKAFYYVEQWREYCLEIINDIGKTAREQTLDRVVKAIQHNPGIMRSTIMQNYRLSAKEADMTFATLEQRGLINRTKAGRGEKFYPVQ